MTMKETPILTSLHNVNVSKLTLEGKYLFIAMIKGLPAILLYSIESDSNTAVITETMTSPWPHAIPSCIVWTVTGHHIHSGDAHEGGFVTQSVYSCSDDEQIRR